MTLWIRVDASIGDNPKVWRLAELRGVSVEATVGHIVLLFGKVGEHATKGDLSAVPDSLVESWAKWKGEPGTWARDFRQLFVSDGVIDGWAERQGALIERAERERQRWHQRKAAESPSNPPISLRGVSARKSAARNGTVHKTPIVPSSGDVNRVLEHYQGLHPKRKIVGEKLRKVVSKALGDFSAEELIEALDGNAADKWHVERKKHELAYVFRDVDMINNFRERAGSPKTNGHRPVAPAVSW